MASAKGESPGQPGKTSAPVFASVTEADVIAVIKTTAQELMAGAVQSIERAVRTDKWGDRSANLELAGAYATLALAKQMAEMTAILESLPVRLQAIFPSGLGQQLELPTQEKGA